MGHVFNKCGILLCLIWLCELAEGVRGCKSGFYGNGCNRRCPSSCKTDACSPSGLCADCKTGLYGIRCDHACPTSCIHNECYRYNVTCTRGCKQGWYGKKCEQQCTDCTGDCHRTTGRCSTNNSSDRTELRQIPPRCGPDSIDDDGCVAGCRRGNCDTPCPDICLQCDRYGDNCTSCVAGKYGARCDKTCPGSCPRTCDMYGECVSTEGKGMKIAVDGTDPWVTKNYVDYDTDDTRTIITIAAVLGALLLTTAVARVIYQYALRWHHSKQSDGTKISCRNTDFAVLLHTNSRHCGTRDTQPSIIPETENCVLLPAS